MNTETDQLHPESAELLQARHVALEHAARNYWKPLIASLPTAQAAWVANLRSGGVKLGLLISIDGVVDVVGIDPKGGMVTITQPRLQRPYGPGH